MHAEIEMKDMTPDGVTTFLKIFQRPGTPEPLRADRLDSE